MYIELFGLPGVGKTTYLKNYKDSINCFDITVTDLKKDIRFCDLKIFKNIYLLFKLNGKNNLNKHILKSSIKFSSWDNKIDSLNYDNLINDQGYIVEIWSNIMDNIEYGNFKNYKSYIDNFVPRFETKFIYITRDTDTIVNNILQRDGTSRYDSIYDANYLHRELEIGKKIYDEIFEIMYNDGFNVELLEL